MTSKVRVIIFSLCCSKLDMKNKAKRLLKWRFHPKLIMLGTHYCDIMRMAPVLSVLSCPINQCHFDKYYPIKLTTHA